MSPSGSHETGSGVDGGADLAVRVTVGAAWAEVAGAMLREELGPYAEEQPRPFSGDQGRWRQGDGPR